MSIATEVERIKTNIANAYTACEEKGATMPSVRNSDSLANCISSVTGGGVDIDNGYVTNGLLLHLSGLRKPISNVWIDDLREKTAILYNSPTYDADNKNYLFNGVNQYCISDVQGATKEFTIEVYAKRLSGSDRLDVGFGTNHGVDVGYGVCNNSGYSYCWLKAPSSNTITLPTADRIPLINDRKFYTRMSRESGTVYYNLKDIERNVAKNFNATSADIVVSDLVIARSGSTAGEGYSKCEIYAVRIYNRKLTDEEIQQNYEQDVLNFGE